MAAKNTDEIGVTGVARIGQQDMLARIECQPHHQHQRPGGARRNEDSPRVQTDVVAMSIKGRNGVPEVRQAGRWRVLDVSVPQRLGRGRKHPGRGREIRLADFHVHDIPALPLELPGSGEDFHDMERADLGESLGNVHG